MLIDFVEMQIQENQLLENIIDNLDKIDSELKFFNNIRGYEDLVYRFYHKSKKVFQAQGKILDGYNLLRKLDPKKEKKFDDYYEQIVREAISKEFSSETNIEWTKETRPLIESFLHTRYFLEQALNYGLEFEKGKIPMEMPYGWAALRTLYGSWPKTDDPSILEYLLQKQREKEGTKSQ